MSKPQTPAERAAVIAALQAEQNAAIAPLFEAARTALNDPALDQALTAVTAAVADLPADDPVAQQVAAFVQSAAMLRKTVERKIVRLGTAE